MSPITRIIVFEYLLYEENPKKYKKQNTHKLYKDFKKVPSYYCVRDRLFNMLYDNLDNKDNEDVKKYHRIVKYMKEYKNNFNGNSINKEEIRCFSHCTLWGA